MLNFTNKPYVQLIPILIGLFFASDDQTVVVTILPKIMLDLRIGIGELEKAAWTITGYLIGYVAVMPIMGRFSDIFGRKKIYALAMTIFIVGSVGTALTGSFDNYNDNLLIERINTGATKVSSLERVPPDLEEILRTATGISDGINLQEEE